MDKVIYKNITISNISIHNEERVVFAQPGQVLEGHLNYSIKTEDQPLFHRYHLIVGLKGKGAQDCVTHTYGVTDSKTGERSFTLTAPMEPGIYQVRFFYDEAITCAHAREQWNELSGDPSNQATIGVIIVK